MFALLAALFIVFSALEIYVLVLVGQAIGALNTLGLVILIALVGAWLAKHEGAAVIPRIQRQIEAGKMPSNELIDGGLILVGGTMLIAPGFITDIIGITLLFPPTRAGYRALIKRRFKFRIMGVGIPPVGRRAPQPPQDATGTRTGDFTDRYGPDDVIDV